jgi:hypothetical protein
LGEGVVAAGSSLRPRSIRRANSLGCYCTKNALCVLKRAEESRWWRMGCACVDYCESEFLFCPCYRVCSKRVRFVCDVEISYMTCAWMHDLWSQYSYNANVPEL